ncbi:hypothetical protein D3C75_1244150 [compost metagenome]
MNNIHRYSRVHRPPGIPGIADRRTQRNGHPHHEQPAADISEIDMGQRHQLN